MRADWELKKLNDIGKVFNGNSINEKVKKDKYTDLDDGLPFIATKDVGFDSRIDYQNGVRIPFNELNQFKIASSNTPLICAEGGSAGRKISFTNQDVCFGNKLFAFAPNKNVDSKYVYYYYFSTSFQKHFSTELAGIIGGVSMNKFKDIEIPLPPLPEQQRIVAILDECFAALEKAKANTEQNLKNAKELFESLLIKIFIEGINIKKWKLEKLEKYNKVVVGYVGPISKEYTNDENGILLLSTKNIGNKGVSLEKLTRINHQFHNKNKKSQLVPGDILVARHGNSGQSAVIPDNIKAAHALNVIVIKKSETLSSEYICFLLNSGVLDKIASSKGGSVQEIINTSVIKDLIIPVPSIKEQETIVNKLDALSAESKKLEAIYNQKIADLEELKKSILQKAFAGELTGVSN